MEPYASGKPAIIFKKDVVGRLVTVHGTIRASRGIEPIVARSRAVGTGEVHELLTAGEDEIARGLINNTAYIGFVEFLAGGLIMIGDKVFVRDRCVGTIAGFDDTHMPNHMNIIVGVPSPVSGRQLGADLGNAVFFVADDPAVAE